MNKRFRHSAPSFRFRRWSRKAYAAFCSLGRCVTIGRVCKSIAEASLLKVAAQWRLLCQASSPAEGTSLHACMSREDDIGQYVLLEAEGVYGQPAGKESPCGKGALCLDSDLITRIISKVYRERQGFRRYLPMKEELRRSLAAPCCLIK